MGFDYPTANMKIPYDETPARGVWAVSVKVGNKKYIGAANIGFAPTLKNEKQHILEVFILSFHKNIYGKNIKITFLERVRDEKKFRTKDALVKQVEKDIARIRVKYLKSKK